MLSETLITTKIDAAQNEVALNNNYYHKVRWLYFLAVISAATIGDL